MDRITLLGIPIDRMTMGEALEAIEGFVHERAPRHIVTADASMVVLARENPDLMAIVQSADLVTPDGAGLLWASRLLGRKISDRVSGVDLVAQVCQLSATSSITIFFLGAAPDVAEEAAVKLRDKYPGAQIVGTRDGYFTADEEAGVVAQIAAVKPDVLFVAFGIPKQELFIRRNQEALNVPVSVGIGGSFDVYSGRVDRAPLWMQNVGLEWLFRLAQNPKKIGKVMTLPRFAILAVWTRMTGAT